jgi:hypothetical protein
MKVLSVYRCVVISYVGRCCVWMEIYLLILSSSNLQQLGGTEKQELPIMLSSHKEHKMNRCKENSHGNRENKLIKGLLITRHVTWSTVILGYKRNNIFKFRLRK